MNKTISIQNIHWSGRSSSWLYFYEYLFFIIAAIGLSYFFSMVIWAGLALIILFMINAKMMWHEVTDEAVNFSASLFDRDSNTVYLKEIKGFYIIDAKPWSFFSLGTLILIEDYSEEAHPCIKCIKNPHKLMRLIKRLANEQGAELE
jgi:hypothetical protein